MEQEQRIKCLRINRIVFGEMDSDIKLEAKRIGPKNFLCYNGAKKWDQAQGFEDWRTYRLKADYQEPPAIIECEVFKEDHHLHFDKNGQQHSLHQAMDETNFSGFESDGWLFGRLYKNKKHGNILTHIRATSIADFDILPIDAVVFSNENP